MLDLLAAILAQQSNSGAKRKESLPIFSIALVAGLSLVALGFLAVALWFAIAPPLGPVAGALVVAAIAAVLALLASVPLWRKAEPEPSVAATLLELALAVGAGLLAERKPKAGSKPKG